MKVFAWNGIIFVCGFLLTIFVLDYSSRQNQVSPESSEINKSWDDLASKKVEASTNKKRNLIPSKKTSRSPSSEDSDLIVSNGKANFILQGDIVEIQKNTSRNPIKKLSAINLKSGKKGYASGEIVITTQSLPKLPILFDGIEIKIGRQLSKTKYLLVISPAFELPKALEYLKTNFLIDSLKVDIVDREIKAL